MTKRILMLLTSFALTGAASAQTQLAGGSSVAGVFSVSGKSNLREMDLTYWEGGTKWTIQNIWGDLQFFPDGDSQYRQIKFTKEGNVLFPRKVSIGDVFCTTPSDCTGDGDMHINNLMLAVGGRVGARYGVHVLNVGAAWPDYVFAPRYQLADLPQVEKFIQANHHLPGIPSEAEVRANGVELVTMQAALLKKVEELTLYVITLQKQNDALQTRVLKLEQ